MTTPLDTEAVRARLEEYRERLEALERERDEASADAEQQTAGMKTVALYRAANAAACIGRLARPLLDESDRLARRVSELEGAILDIDAHAHALGSDEDGFNSGGYIVSIGSLHRALGVVGHSGAKPREHAVMLDTAHGPDCAGCEALKVIALDAVARRGRPG